MSPLANVSPLTTLRSHIRVATTGPTITPQSSGPNFIIKNHPNSPLYNTLLVQPTFNFLRLPPPFTVSSGESFFCSSNGETNAFSQNGVDIHRLVLSFLRPPYLYLLINCIIISIVASSKLQHKAETQQSPSPEIVLPAVKVSSEVYSSEYSYGSDTSARVVVAEDLSTVEESKEAVVVDGGDEEEEQVKVVMSLPPPPPPPARSESMELVMSLLNEKAGEKPPVSKRFGQRKAVKAASEGKALRVSKPKRHDTLESTWKTITEGRPMPLTRHLKKSDTWEQRAQKDPNAPPPPLPHTVKKSDTFNERPNGTSLTRSSGSGKLKKDPSLSQDDLNRRVEAFIKKFNEEMRLQRQESWNQYQEMIRRGAE